MLLLGMLISAITDRLTMDHAKFSRLMECSGDDQRLSRDNFVTYGDVYNVLYALTVKQMRKDDNPTTSAQLWMDDLKRQGYFTYCDQEHSLYYEFLSPWQLDELRKWGDAFCFDGTHQVCE